MPRATDVSHTRSRSRSPFRSSSSHHDRVRSTRSGSPHHRHHHRHHHARTHKVRPVIDQIELPLEARALSRDELQTFRPLLALYLDIQKNLLIEDLSEDEVRGRWKSFVNKWNRGELAEGYYDPTTFEKAKASASEEKNEHPFSIRQPDHRKAQPDQMDVGDPHEADMPNKVEDEDDYGPVPPDNQIAKPRASGISSRPGPSIPRLQDLEYQRDLSKEDAAETRRQETQGLRTSRLADRAQQKDLLDSIAPKAEAGSRERQLEKRREAAASNRSFAQAKEQGDVELRDADVMGGGEEESLGELKRVKQQEERKKNERELRRDEVLRARQAERDDRLSEMKKKEAKTMEMLKEIARARFGPGAGTGLDGGG